MKKLFWLLPLLAVIACDPKDPRDALVVKGEDIFFNETFDGNGRTCGTCHRVEDNFTITPSFIATLPPDDALFVSETNPDLAENFENAKLIRELGLIIENLDGFDDLENKFNLRGVPHVLGLRNSIDSFDGPKLGWSGDGSPEDGTLRSFTLGAIKQHFTKTLNREEGVDFRNPTDEELDALEAFQLSLGKQEEIVLPLPLKGIVAARGQEIFMDNTLGKCNVCHFNAGANGNPAILDPFMISGNLNFDTGVEALPDQPQDLTDELVPPDDGSGSPVLGLRGFNTPGLVEAADTGPFFHNNSVETIEGAVAFYNGDSFNDSPAGQVVIGATGSGINLDATQTVAVAAFLRVINALENIRESIDLLHIGRSEQTERALFEIQDAIDVLKGAGLHPSAVAHLDTAKFRAKHRFERLAILELLIARKLLVE